MPKMGKGRPKVKGQAYVGAITGLTTQESAEARATNLSTKRRAWQRYHERRAEQLGGGGVEDGGPKDKVKLFHAA